MKSLARAAAAATLLFLQSSACLAHPVVAGRAHTVSAHSTAGPHNRGPQGHAHTLAPRH